tara:strand:- start:3980 stop:4636 length:657 start_codon:yes stop_codon:yes gene_type:complete
MVGMTEKFNEISMNATKIFIGIFMAIHLIVNSIIAAIVNGKDSDKNTKKGSFIAHTIVSIIVFVLLIFVMKTGIFPFVGKLVKQDLFNKGFTIISFPMFIHLAVSTTFTVISFIEQDESKLKNLSNVFNGISSLACLTIIILCFVSAETLMGMEDEAKKMKDKAKKMKEKALKPAETPAVETTDVKVETKKPAAAKDVEEFGKRQRRRNPPKRRKKKY